jgi:hypothetical protein
MDETAFTEALIAALRNAELERYCVLPEAGLAAVSSHLQVGFDVEAIRRDRASPGGIKGSHAQRRMLMLLVALWRPGAADELFGEGLSALPRAIMAMDRRNRAILAELIETYPGWDDGS